jgi:hypothetical protein
MFNPIVGQSLVCLSNLAGDNSMKIDGNIQIPNIIVYFVVYAVLFGISIWLLVFHPESPNNWFLYVAMVWSVLAGLVKFALQYRKKRQQPA